MINLLTFWLAAYLLFMVDVLLNTVGIPMSINCAFLLADLYLYSSKVDVMQWPLKENKT